MTFSEFHYMDFIPTFEQYKYCLEAGRQLRTLAQIEAAAIIVSSYRNKKAISHNYIHIINSLKRKKQTT